MNSHRWHPSPPPSPSQPAPWHSQIINGLQLYSEITTWLIAPLHKVDSNPNFTWVFCRARASTATRLSSLQARGWNTLPAKHHRGVYLFRKPNFQLSHILAWLIFSCPPIGQECEFSVVRIKVDLFSYENCVLGQNLHFQGIFWLWMRRKHIVLIRRHGVLKLAVQHNPE